MIRISSPVKIDRSMFVPLDAAPAGHEDLDPVDAGLRLLSDETPDLRRTVDLSAQEPARPSRDRQRHAGHEDPWSAHEASRDGRPQLEIDVAPGAAVTQRRDAGRQDPLRRGRSLQRGPDLGLSRLQLLVAEVERQVVMGVDQARQHGERAPVDDGSVHRRRGLLMYRGDSPVVHLDDRAGERRPPSAVEKTTASDEEVHGHASMGNVRGLRIDQCEKCKPYAIIAPQEGRCSTCIPARRNDDRRDACRDRAGEITCVQIVQHYIDRARAFNGVATRWSPRTAPP